MIWAILALLGVPLWFCALGIGVLVFRNRALSHRPGNIPVRVLRPGKTRWTRGHGIWVSDVFAWRGSPAAWTKDLVPAKSVQLRTATATEHKPLRRLGDDPAVAVLTSHRRRHPQRRHRSRTSGGAAGPDSPLSASTEAHPAKRGS